MYILRQTLATTNSFQQQKYFCILHYIMYVKKYIGIFLNAAEPTVWMSHCVTNSQLLFVSQFSCSYVTNKIPINIHTSLCVC